MAPDEVLVGKMQAPPFQRVGIVLEPLNHPELGPVAIDDGLFAIGRTEQPFAAYPPEIVADLSRRHARVFVEGGDAYIADLGSKNGTTVNGVAVRHGIVRLHDGDEVGLARVLAYRVRLQASPPAAAPVARLASLTLEPERTDLGLEPIVITSFPFLISKVDDTFARYKEKEPHQVGYLSRRHAHIFLKGGVPYVEDLGSTNGTFIGAVRLDEHAHALEDGDVLAFGGHHFVYRVRLQWEQAGPEPTITRVSSPPAAHAPAAATDADHTTFVASAGSFLDIFCADDQAGAQDDEVNPAAAEPPRDTRGKAALMTAALLDAMGAAGDADPARLRRWLAVAGAVVVAMILLFHLAGAPERALQGLVDSGDFVTAARLADDRLARDPDNADVKSLGTEALLKAELPQWMADLKAGRFDRASQAEARMRRLAGHNADAQPLVAEIAWVGDVERFVHARGGAAAPVRDAADGARVRRMVRQWQDEQPAHQRAFATISAYVPAFRDTYAQAASDLRKLALAGGGDGNE
ncbi:FHA domain-containing protein [Massilia sp. PDC64]|nr:FHA domain-containing protein [Massilia sp. PDC64]SDE21001.1 FHA domain-containing protein [Massilia sp. PDC64]